MKCPIDGANLVMTERSGVEIDYCPECRGIWLDRGELDKIIQRSAGEESRYRDEDHQRRSDAPHEQDYNDKKKRRGSFIGDIFGGFGED